ncbi:MAG: hypothetical protein M1489_04605 [Firmicutes bacterium]|nr:hypothetical protein [Bacillota bacterium]
MKEDTEVKETWISLTEDEFLAGFMAAFVTVDKMAILADGLDTAVLTVTSTMPEVNIYNDETADLVAIISIDPETNTGTLPITATDHGSIRLRAGLPLKSKVNQVEVFFSAI